MERTFRARSDAMCVAEKKKKREFIQAVGYTLLMIMAFVCRGEGMARNLAKDFNTDVSTVRGVLTFFGFGFLFMVIMSVILYVIASRELRRLRSNFVMLRDDDIYGMSCARAQPWNERSL